LLAAFDLVLRDHHAAAARGRFPVDVAKRIAGAVLAQALEFRSGAAPA
jgi:hypothetical protein